MSIFVCDAPMGAGKTEAAITQMNRDTESRYIFLSPYLTEIERIQASCPERGFVAPVDNGAGKLDDLHHLLRQKRNIASTHALFSRYTDGTRELIEKGGYRLILDEAFDTVERLCISKNDFDIGLNSNIFEIAPSDGRVIWKDQNYRGYGFQRFFKKSGDLFCQNGAFFYWNFPVNIFESFRSVTILTYLFDAYPQKGYFDANGMHYSLIGTERAVDGHFQFAEYREKYECLLGVRDRVHILDKPKLNRIGKEKTALSSGWYDREARKAEDVSGVTQLRRNLCNVYRNIYQATSSTAMWTTFKKYREPLTVRGYKKSFVPSNLRATNTHSGRTHLAYCVNPYINPFFKNYLRGIGAELNHDRYALSNMIQWVWRSAIRRGGEIWLYVPSSRMRSLFTDWLDEVSSL